LIHFNSIWGDNQAEVLGAGGFEFILVDVDLESCLLKAFNDLADLLLVLLLGL
jgi:hypothetical protein